MIAQAYTGPITTAFPYTVRALVHEKERLITLASHCREVPEVEKELFRLVNQIDQAIDVLLAPEDKPNE